MNKIGTLHNKHILLLQGPIGLFFKRLDFHLRNGGAKTYRIGFNMGDSLFSYHDNYTPYRGLPENWADFITSYLESKQIEMIFLFGDCRFYQKTLVQIARKRNIEIYVFEEGYVRPHYITLERYGVNNYSHLPRNASFYHATEIDGPIHTKDATPNAITNWGIVIIYYWVAKVFHFRYRHYQHHREYSATKELFFGLRSLTRKVIYTQQDKKYLPIITNKLSKQYFFVPLQTHNDFQILQHSHYGSIEKFIIEVLESFSNYARPGDMLLFKHHPIDRGRKNYKKFIAEQASGLNIEKRIIVLHDLHLPTCLKHAKGTVTINSTVGLSSLYHGIPTIALGSAIYDIEGLTSTCSLNDFWTKFEYPNETLFQKYRNYLIKETQLNGSFYGLFPKELYFSS